MLYVFCTRCRCRDSVVNANGAAYFCCEFQQLKCTIYIYICKIFVDRTQCSVAFHGFYLPSFQFIIVISLRAACRAYCHSFPVRWNFFRLILFCVAVFVIRLLCALRMQPKRIRLRVCEQINGDRGKTPSTLMHRTIIKKRNKLISVSGRQKQHSFDHIKYTHNDEWGFRQDQRKDKISCT